MLLRLGEVEDERAPTAGAVISSFTSTNNDGISLELSCVARLLISMYRVK
jgi:hypothetical protein